MILIDHIQISSVSNQSHIFQRLKDIAMAFQQMSQEENNKVYIPLALYLGKTINSLSNKDIKLMKNFFISQ